MIDRYLEPDCYEDNDAWIEHCSEAYEEYLASFDPEDEDTPRMTFEMFEEEMADRAEASYCDTLEDREDFA